MADAPGLRIDGRYELIAPVGEGGMAIVWRGVTHGAVGFRRDVAIKRIRDELRGQPHIVEMFVEEARVDSMLRHPNVVQIHDFGVDANGDHYLVSEWVEGIHLEQYARAFSTAGEPAPYDFVAAIGVEVLRALNASHANLDERGQPLPILHRDVTPQNILLDVTGIVKLADFGMARAADRARITHPDILKGKISYMAPEMTRGIGPNESTDLYAVGIVLWEALAGRRLYHAPTDGEVFQMLQNPRVPMLSMIRPDLPLSLATIVHRALETDPSRRYASALEMLRALSNDLRALGRPVGAAALSESIVEARARLQALSPGTRVDAHSKE